MATGATANSTDAQLRDRTTHTGAQAIGTITGLQTALDGKAPTLGADDNYVTDAEKVKLANTSGTNTGDQTLPTWTTLSGKPAVIAAGADAAAARTAIGAGTSNLAIGTTAGTAKAGDYAPDLSGLLTTAAAPELIRDTMGTALVAGANVTITKDDPGDTITIAASGIPAQSLGSSTLALTGANISPGQPTDPNRWLIFGIPTAGLPTVAALSWRVNTGSSGGLASAVYIYTGTPGQLTRIADGGIAVVGSSVVQVMLDTPQVLPAITYLALKKTGGGDFTYKATAYSTWAGASTSWSYSPLGVMQSSWQAGDTAPNPIVVNDLVGFAEFPPPSVRVTLQ